MILAFSSAIPALVETVNDSRPRGSLAVTGPDLEVKEVQTAREPGRDSDWPDYGVSLVVAFSFYFGKRTVCPGTSLSFSFPQFMEDVRSDFEIDSMNLGAYRGGSLEAGSFGIM